MPRYREEYINIRFADILKEMGFKATAEIISKGKLPDIMVNIDGVKINIEGRFEKSLQAEQLEERCRERVEDGICDIAVGVIYSEELREAENDSELIKKIKKSDFKAFVVSVTPKGAQKRELGTIKIQDAAEKLNYLYTEIINTDLLQEQIKKISKVIEETGEIATTSGLFFSSEKVIRKLEDALAIKGVRHSKKDRQNLLKIGLFMIFDGLLFHEVFSSTILARKENIQSLRARPETNVASFIKTEWEKIKKIDYLPIFSLAYSICSCFPTSPESDEILKKLIKTTLDVVSSGVLLKHDLMGRVYHRLLLKTTGKHYAAYYTGIPAAWILCNLSIKTPSPDVNWFFKNLTEIRDFKVIDPACGSGTLLSGIYMALKDKYIFDRYRVSVPEDLNLNEFHRLMMEKILNGWDVLDYAGHLTLTNLALKNPNITFVRSNIYILPVGETIKGKIYLGSLSYLNKGIQQQLPIKDIFVTFPKRKGVDIEEEKMIRVSKHSMDVVIMNPPFSRSAKPNVKFGFTGKKVMQEMNKKLRKLGRDSGYKTIGQAGLGAYFIVLADQLLKPGGRLGLVIPRAILSGVSWREIREKIFLKGYEIEYIVSNYDPGDKRLNIEPWNWSENTNLGEVLIVARKTNKPQTERYTTFVNLWNKPKNEIESLIIDEQCIKGRQEKDSFSFENGTYKFLKLNKDVGVVYNINQKNLEYNFLYPALFANPHLNKLVFDLLEKHSLPLSPLGDITQDLGVDIKQVKDTFKQTNTTTPYKIVWGHNSLMNTLEIDSDQVKYGQPQSKTTSIYERAANLLLATRPHLKTENLVAMYSADKVLATAFWEVQINEEEAEILALWLNSTPGFLIYLSNSVNSMGEIFKVKKAQIERLPIIDVNVLSVAQRKKLLNLYQELKDEPFQPFPQEFKLAHMGKGKRKQIDDEFIKILKLNINLKPYYKMLSNEPALTLKRL